MRVVLVATQQPLRESIAAILERAGHVVAGFAETASALAYLKEDQAANAFIVAGVESATAGMDICREGRLLASFQRPIYICLLSAPLSSDTMVEALDCGADDVLHLPLSPDELHARLRSAERFNQMQLKMVEMATHDGLTGMLNRPAFFERAVKMCRETTAPLAAIMVDIDHFKSINDRFGHAAGDTALRAVAQRLIGNGELAGRLGGEEFALLLPQGDPDDAWRAAEALRGEIEAREIAIETATVTVTCSFGVAIGAPGDDIDDLLRRADAALYVAKRAGRNLVAYFDPETPDVPNRPNSVIRCHAEPDGLPLRRAVG
ncbi:diguanylate cyclase [Rhodoblastus sp.]|jgi:diguanylate cyclase (GGDEF)-like protein|uniref:GGDEF domain-containing response regulator n=1 Tax=Rhodoblastus sp. TaxID=1962975 RepID=UPI0025EC5ED1|nr:diguanylate cyclase [Rhodoblastus sp.]